MRPIYNHHRDTLLLTRDEARRIAANIVKLPKLVQAAQRAIPFPRLLSGIVRVPRASSEQNSEQSFTIFIRN